MGILAGGVRVVEIAERGESFVSLSGAQAALLQEMRFCRLSPTPEPGLWRITDVSRVGVVAVDDIRILVRPKTPLRSLIFMASYSGTQAALGDASFDFDADTDLPAALAAALVRTVASATGRGLLKGYVPVEETGTVIRGRWDIARQLKTRPGIPVPVELTYDDYTEDVLENRILKAALRALVRQEQLPGAVTDRLGTLLALFSEVSDLRPSRDIALPPPSRQNSHYQPALRIARWILEATSWAQRAGSRSGSTFLVNVATVFERFVGEVLRASMARDGYDVDLQRTDWRLDAEGAIRLRPDIVVSRDGRVVTVADTKYKVWGTDTGSPPNADVYQALAYAVTAGVDETHLLYVSGEVTPRRYEVTATGTTIIAHALDLSGRPEELVARVRRLGDELVGQPATARG